MKEILEETRAARRTGGAHVDAHGSGRARLRTDQALAGSRARRRVRPVRRLDARLPGIRPGPADRGNCRGDDLGFAGLAPDLVMLDLPPELGAARRDEPEDRFEKEDRAFFDRVRTPRVTLRNLPYRSS